MCNERPTDSLRLFPAFTPSTYAIGIVYFGTGWLLPAPVWTTATAEHCRLERSRTAPQPQNRTTVHRAQGTPYISNVATNVATVSRTGSAGDSRLDSRTPQHAEHEEMPRGTARSLLPSRGRPYSAPRTAALCVQACPTATLPARVALRATEAAPPSASGAPGTSWLGRSHAHALDTSLLSTM